MPHQIPISRREERLAIAKLVVGIAKSYHATIFPDGDVNFAASTDELFVSTCVFIGHAEQKPMNATKIAHYLDMPRTTVLRKLKNLEERGVVRRHGNVYAVSQYFAQRFDHAEKIIRLVRRAAAALPST